MEFVTVPEFVVSSTNVQIFESRLDKVWSNQPVRFCYKEELRLPLKLYVTLYTVAVGRAWLGVF